MKNEIPNPVEATLLKMVFMNQRLQINLMHIPSIRIFLCFSLFGFILRALFPIDVSQICLQSSLLKWWKALLGSSISEKKLKLNSLGQLSATLICYLHT